MVINVQNPREAQPHFSIQSLTNKLTSQHSPCAIPQKTITLHILAGKGSLPLLTRPLRYNSRKRLYNLAFLRV